MAEQSPPALAEPHRPAHRALLQDVGRRALVLLESQGSPQGQLTGDDATLIGRLTSESRDGEKVIRDPFPPVAELTDTHPARLPPKRVAALIRKAKKLSAQGVSWKKIAKQWNAEGIPTHSGIGQWHGSTVKHMVEKHE